YIIIILIRDLESGPYKIMPKFIFKFTKEYLSIKEAYVFFLPYFYILLYIYLIALKAIRR
ncbi:uncharacterized protein K441DRAFT_539803, partial [Cenococcum geophilum 1.58]|uniref:uncharacterized protein n=1 Tax=Cenococcum geophilum 1.58 TaxID=794803 RepID=UPI00358E4FDC